MAKAKHDHVIFGTGLVATTFAKNKAGQLIATTMEPEELGREWTVIKHSEYDDLLAGHESDMKAHNADYAATLQAEADDKARLRANAAAKLGLTVEELSALLG